MIFSVITHGLFLLKIKKHYSYKFFSKKLKESNPKPNIIRSDKGSEFYNRSTKSWFKKNIMKMYSAHIEGKPVVAGRFIRTLNSNNYKYMTSISKYVYIDTSDEITNKCNNTYNRTIKNESY